MDKAPTMEVKRPKKGVNNPKGAAINLQRGSNDPQMGTNDPQGVAMDLERGSNDPQIEANEETRKDPDEDLLQADGRGEVGVAGAGVRVDGGDVGQLGLIDVHLTEGRSQLQVGRQVGLRQRQLHLVRRNLHLQSRPCYKRGIFRPGTIKTRSRWITTYCTLMF